MPYFAKVPMVLFTEKETTSPLEALSEVNVAARILSSLLKVFSLTALQSLSKIEEKAR